MNMQVSIPTETPVRDLADFHLRWRDFRNTAVNVLDIQALNAAERETITWLIRMADKIGKNDLE